MPATPSVRRQLLADGATSLQKACSAPYCVHTHPVPAALALGGGAAALTAPLEAAAALDPGSGFLSRWNARHGRGVLSTWP